MASERSASGLGGTFLGGEGKPLTAAQMQRRSSSASKTGYLTKRAMSTPGLNWKKRFFVLSEGNISYYRQGSGGLTGMLGGGGSAHVAYLKGEVDLTPDSYVQESDCDKKLFGFEVVTPSKTLYCDAESEADRTEWIASVRQHIKELKARAAGVGSSPRGQDEAARLLALPQVTEEGDEDGYAGASGAHAAEGGGYSAAYVRRLVDENTQLREALRVKVHELEEARAVIAKAEAEGFGGGGGGNERGSLGRRASAATLDLREVSRKQHQLHSAAEDGDTDTVLALLAQPMVDVNGRDKDGRLWTALHIACDGKVRLRCCAAALLLCCCCAAAVRVRCCVR